MVRSRQAIRKRPASRSNNKYRVVTSGNLTRLAQRVIMADGEDVCGGGTPFSPAIRFRSRVIRGGR
jgi:hypothetical protein